MADISIIHDGDNNIDYNIKDAIGRANCSTGLQNLEDCIISILPESVIDDTTPISFLSNGDPLSSVGLIGNGQQTGTPTPDAPIIPTFCGVRTGNLFDSTTSVSGILDNNGDVTSNSVYGTSEFIRLDAEFTISLISVYASQSRLIRCGYYTESKQHIANDASTSFKDGYKAFTFTPPDGTAYIRFSFISRAGYEDSNIMLNLGTTALPYEPYGYKIPITCAGQTVPVYLGQTQTVRRIKKLVLTGEENWRLYKLTGATNVERFYLVVSKNTISTASIISTHFPTLADDSDTEHTRCGGSPINEVYIYISRTVATTVAELKSYLAAQYAAGVPVTVWYVLAEPETAIVNEPLCKIGDYADELNITDTDVTIPTTRGQNTLTVETDLQPSEIKVTGNIVGTGETESHIVTDNVDIPTDIPSNSDLDTYATDGVYRITDIFIAATILNAPVTNVKYILEVFSVSDTDTIQRITTESDIYTRQKSSGVWGSWYKFTGTEVST